MRNPILAACLATLLLNHATASEKGPQQNAAVPGEHPKLNLKGRPEATTGLEVYHRFKDRYKGVDSVMDISLYMVNKRGEHRSMKLQRYRRRKEGLTSTLFFFVAPADVRGTATLTIEQKEGDDLQRIYLPALKKHRRIAQGDKGKKWLGTDLAYEDLQERRPEDFTYSKMDEQVIEGNACYHFSMYPKTKGASSYGHLEYWIRKDNDEMTRGRYYNEAGKLIKLMRMGQYHVTIEPETGKTIHSATWMVMYNYEDQHRTVLITERARYNVGLKDDQFSPRFLESMPAPFDGGERYRTKLEDCLFEPESQDAATIK